MYRLAKRFALIVYAAVVVALLVNYLMGLRWFRGYDKAVAVLVASVAAWIGSWLRSRAEKKAEMGEVVVEALDANGAVHSDPKSSRFVVQTVIVAIGSFALVCLAIAYRDHARGKPMVNAAVLLALVVIVVWVFRRRLGGICQVESDDGVTLIVRRRGEMTRVPWSQVLAVEVSRPYTFWQVVVKFRPLGASRDEAIRFLPLGWRKMAPSAAEKLRVALEARRTAR